MFKGFDASFAACCAIVIVGLVGQPGCNRAADRPTQEVRLQGPHGAEWPMGEAQQQAREFFENLVELLEVNLGEPERAVQRVEAYVQANRTAMQENAAALEAYALQLGPEERAIYDAQFGQFMEPVVTRWFQVRQRLAQRGGQHVRRVERLLNSVSR